MSQARQQTTYPTDQHMGERIFAAIGTVVGWSLGIYTPINLTAKDITSFPNVDSQLAEALPLAFYWIVIPVLVSGQVINAYDRFGKSVDFLINDIKRFPLHGTKEEIKTWVKSLDAKKWTNIIGAALGIALFFAYLPRDLHLEDNHFALPYNAHQYLPKPLVEILSLILIAGFFSNAIHYCSRKTEETVKLAKTPLKALQQHVSKYTGSLFSRQATVATPVSQALPPAPEHRNSITEM